ncbi:MAG: M56 family metallopeptidase [Rhodothermales bacterium]
MNAIYDLTSLWDSLAAGADVLAISSLKAIIILGMAGLVALMFKKASASVRHGIWSFALASVLVLLPLSLLMPAWPVAMLPQATPSLAEVATPLAEPTPKADVRLEASSSAHTSAPTLVLEKSSKTISATPSPEPRLEPVPPAEPMPSAAVLPAPEEAVAEASLLSTALEVARGISWAGWAMLLWAAGVAGVMMYFLLGTVRAWWWTRRAEPVRDEAWTTLTKDISWELYLKKPVRLVWSDRAAMPMAWGFFRPVVLLPRSASEWTSERRRVVLLHEMAHIQRGDNLTQTLAQFACALYWFNPVVWWGARQLRIERERACDDQVITSGTKPSAYATHLLAIARSLKATPGTPLGAVSMARPSQLEGRLLAILEPKLSRRTLSRARACFTGALFAAAIFPLAAMQPGADDAGQTSGDEPQHASQQALLSYSYTTDEGEPDEKKVTSATSPDDEVVERTFEVSPGGTLNVRTDRGSIEVETVEADEVAVRVEIEARSDEDRQKFDLSFEQENNDVSVRGEVEGRGNWNGDRLRIKYIITVPSQYNVDLQTSGGSISVEDLEGEVVTQTSGGSLSFGMIRGNINGQTSGGSISLDGTSGDADVHTSGGSISLGKVAGTVKAHTSGGSISIDEVGGSIDAETSGGSITAAITEQPEGDCELRTSGGSITVRLADGIGVDVNAKTSAGRVTTEFDVPPRDKDEMDELEAPINGGGPRLHLRTSAGSVRINRLNGGGTSMNSDRGREGERFGDAQERREEEQEAMEARQEAEEDRQEALEEQQEAMEEAMMEAEEAHAEAMMEMEEAMREMKMDIGDAVEEALNEIDMDEIGETIEEAMEEFEDAMEEMGEELADAFEDGDLPSGNVSGSVNGVEFSGTVAEVMRAMKENFDMEGFAEQIEQSALEGVASAFEEMAYEKDSIKVINDDKEEWRDPLDVIAELPAEYAVPALERVAENHDDAARRQKAADLAAELASEGETPEKEQ